MTGLVIMFVGYVLIMVSDEIRSGKHLHASALVVFWAGVALCLYGLLK